MKKSILIKIISVICLIILIIGVVLSIKAFQLKKILNKIDTYKNIKNYYAKIESWVEETNNSEEKKNIKTQEIFFYNGVMKMTADNMEIWIDYNTNEGYVINLSSKEAKKLNADLIKDYNAPDQNTLSSFKPTILINNFFDYYKTNLKIKSNDEYYILSDENDEYKINKDTGLLELHTLKMLTETQYTKYEVDLNMVKSDEVEMIDLSDYEII